MKTIDTENHFATPMWVEALQKNEGYPRIVEDRETGILRLCHSDAM